MCWSGTWATSAPGRAQVLDDARVRLPDGLAREVGHLGDEAPVVVHRVVDLEPGLAAELVVFLPVAGRDVDQAGARVHRHEVRA